MRASRGPLAALALLTGCLLGPVDFIGKECVTTGDCPDGLVCTAEAPGGATVCVAPAGDVGGADGANAAGPGPGAPDGGPLGPFYCDQVRPILDRYCASCHTSPPTGGAPSTFRLDVYAGTGGLRGAFDQARRIAARAGDPATASMPPSSSPQPSDAARRLLAAWVDAGAPECSDRPATAPLDAGTPPAVVSFAQHLQPIFDTFCASCHTGPDPEGDLDLSLGMAYASLRDRSDCDSGLLRVMPGSPAGSLLWRALGGGGGAGSCAPRMPLNTPGLATIAPDEFLLIERWIAAGAPNN